jgi:hypothetical protein
VSSVKQPGATDKKIIEITKKYKKNIIKYLGCSLANLLIWLKTKKIRASKGTDINWAIHMGAGFALSVSQPQA